VKNSHNKQTHLAGQTIFHEGACAECAYLIDQGRVRIESVTGESRVLLAVLGKNEIFGEMALIDGKTRSATVTAITDTQLVPITRDMIEEKLSRTDAVTRLLLLSLMSRLRTTSSQLSGCSDAFAPDMQPDIAATQHNLSDAVDEITFTNRLDAIIDNRQIELHYQPIVESEHLQLAGFEALLRFKAGTLPDVPLSQVIQIVEANRQILPIGLQVLEQGYEALLQFQNTWRQQSGSKDTLFLSINLSARQLGDADHFNTLLATIQSFKCSGLKLEVTESALLDNPDYAIDQLSALRDAGADLVLDDFGTGYSSLNYLYRFPLQTLKIDISFVHAMTTDEASHRIVKAIIALTHELGMVVVAEGVETQLQLDMLRKMKCDFIQGFLIARPMALNDALDFVFRESLSRHCQVNG
jgi:EAL domain-containing protein (putative c-di-GMP-specific phosphodiesterase class I)